MAPRIAALILSALRLRQAVAMNRHELAARGCSTSSLEGEQIRRTLSSALSYGGTDSANCVRPGSRFGKLLLLQKASPEHRTLRHAELLPKSAHPPAVRSLLLVAVEVRRWH